MFSKLVSPCRKKGAGAFGTIVSGLLLATVTATGCGIRVGEQPASETQVQLGSIETACLSGAARTIDLYLTGQAADRDIAEVWDCASRSLRLFEERTRGETPGVHSPGELKKFLERYFLKKGSVIPQGMVDEMMVLKRTLLGGSVDSLTLDELKQARRLMDTLKVQSVKLRPYMPINLARAAGMDSKDLDQAIDAMRGATQELASVLEGNGSPYTFESLWRLLAEFQAFSRNEDIQAISSRIRRQIPLVAQAKALFISPGTEQIEGRDWKPLLGTVIDAYAVSLRAAHVIKNHPSVTYGAGREQMMALLRDIHGLADQALKRHKNEMIPFQEIDLLLDQVDASVLKFGKYPIDREHVKGVIRTAVRRGLGRGLSGPEGRDAEGLTRPALDQAVKLAELWSEGQRYLERAFERAADNAGLSKHLTRTFRAADLKFDMAELFRSEVVAADSVTAEAARRMERVIAESVPLYQADDLEVHFPGPKADLKHSFYGLSQLNWLYLLGYLLPESYSEDPARQVESSPGVAGVTLAEFTRFYDDLAPIGIAVKIFNPFQEPGKPTVPQKRFTEANLFMFHADQDSTLMNITETAETLALTLSAKALAIRTHSRISKLCDPQNKQPNDFWDYKIVEASCVREELFGDIERYYDHLPRLVAYYRDLERQDKELIARGRRSEATKRAKFECYMQDAGRPDGNGDKPYESPDFEGISGVVQYVEATFMRYDADASGTLSNGEAKVAFDAVFRNALKAVSCSIGKCLEKEGDLLAVFNYVMANGRIPEYTGGFPSSWSEFRDIIRLIKSKKGSIRYEADRTRLLEILAVLGKAGAPPKEGNAAAAAPKPVSRCAVYN